MWYIHCTQIALGNYFSWIPFNDHIWKTQIDSEANRVQAGNGLRRKRRTNSDMEGLFRSQYFSIFVLYNNPRGRDLVFAIKGGVKINFHITGRWWSPTYLCRYIGMFSFCNAIKFSNKVYNKSSNPWTWLIDSLMNVSVPIQPQSLDCIIVCSPLGHCATNEDPGEPSKQSTLCPFTIHSASNHF